MDKKCRAVLVAAGQGNRLGWPAGKALAPLAGLPLFMHSLSTLWGLPHVAQIALVVREEDRPAVEESAARLLPPPPSPPPPAPGARGADLSSRLAVVSGGATRQESVLKGLEALAAAPPGPDDIVLVHDAARPLASARLFLTVLDAAAAGDLAVAPALAVVDSLRRAAAGEYPCAGGLGGRRGVGGTVPVARDSLWRVQTPQGFRFGALLEAHHAAAEAGRGAQDDVAVAEAHGVEVRLVEGEESNLKVTYPADLNYAAGILARGRASRVGLGLDVHPLRPGSGVRLGGVLIPCRHELEGHSDADVITHALMDALLGAAGGGDIGLMFPPGEDRWRDADSIMLLQSVWDRLALEGYLASNVDVTVLAETPKLSPHFGSMRSRLSGAMRCEPWRVNIKATTAERLGFVGRGEGIAAMAVALLHGPETPRATTAAAP